VKTWSAEEIVDEYNNKETKVPKEIAEIFQQVLEKNRDLRISTIEGLLNNEKLF